MKTYEALGMAKADRQRKYGLWTARYREHRFHMRIWIAVFLLLFLLLGGLPFLALLVGFYGK